jgi:hypothetical protein
MLTFSFLIKYYNQYIPDYQNAQQHSVLIYNVNNREEEQVNDHNYMQDIDIGCHYYYCSVVLMMVYYLKTSSNNSVVT